MPGLLAKDIPFKTPGDQLRAAEVNALVEAFHGGHDVKSGFSGPAEGMDVHKPKVSPPRFDTVRNPSSTETVPPFSVFGVAYNDESTSVIANMELHKISEEHFGSPYRIMTNGKFPIKPEYAGPAKTVDQWESHILRMSDVVGIGHPCGVKFKTFDVTGAQRYGLNALSLPLSDVEVDGSPGIYQWCIGTRFPIGMIGKVIEGITPGTCEKLGKGKIEILYRHEGVETLFPAIDPNTGTAPWIVTVYNLCDQEAKVSSPGDAGSGIPAGCIKVSEKMGIGLVWDPCPQICELEFYAIGGCPEMQGTQNPTGVSIPIIKVTFKADGTCIKEPATACPSLTVQGNVPITLPGVNPVGPPVFDPSTGEEIVEDTEVITTLDLNWCEADCSDCDEVCVVDAGSEEANGQYLADLDTAVFEWENTVVSTTTIKWVYVGPDETDYKYQISWSGADPGYESAVITAIDQGQGLQPPFGPDGVTTWLIIDGTTPSPIVYCGKCVPNVICINAAGTAEVNGDYILNTSKKYLSSQSLGAEIRADNLFSDVYAWRIYYLNIPLYRSTEVFKVDRNGFPELDIQDVVWEVQFGDAPVPTIQGSKCICSILCITNAGEITPIIDGNYTRDTSPAGTFDYTQVEDNSILIQMVDSGGGIYTWQINQSGLYYESQTFELDSEGFPLVRVEDATWTAVDADPATPLPTVDCGSCTLNVSGAGTAAFDGNYDIEAGHLYRLDATYTMQLINVAGQNYEWQLFNGSQMDYFSSTRFRVDVFGNPDIDPWDTTYEVSGDGTGPAPVVIEGSV